MSEVNVALLRKAVEWVEEEAIKPEIDRQWLQTTWRTPPETMVYRLLSSNMSVDSNELCQTVDLLTPHCGTAYCVAGYIGQMLDERYAKYSSVDGVHVSDFAQKALGINEEESERLFYAYNSAKDVRKIAEEIAGERL